MTKHQQQQQQQQPSFCFVWYDLPTNSPTNDPTNNCINWIWMSKKIGLNKAKK